MKVVEEIISSFLKDSKEGKKHIVEWFLNNVMEGEAKMEMAKRIGRENNMKDRNGGEAAGSLR
ncbi:MAG: hypothetical protein ACYCSG_04615 [Thermoplasmataceae archaeon]